jgi:hypothetical protein
VLRNCYGGTTQGKRSMKFLFFVSQTTYDTICLGLSTFYLTRNTSSSASSTFRRLLLADGLVYFVLIACVRPDDASMPRLPLNSATSPISYCSFHPLASKSALDVSNCLTLH